MTAYTSLEIQILTSEGYIKNENNIEWLGDYYKTNLDKSVYSSFSKSDSFYFLETFDIDEFMNKTNAYMQTEDNTSCLYSFLTN